MNRSPLPFNILGQVSPILAWVEDDGGGSLPSTWQVGPQKFKDRERSWLLRELPTYSYDNVNEIVDGSRALHKLGHPTPARLPRERPWERRLDAPATYDLLQAFRALNEYFLVWNGTEPCIQQGRMEELHELGIRFPASHIVRHGHARTVSEGVIDFETALELPEQITLLPSNSFGLRSVVRKGLSESHLHLTGVTSAEETWADNLLKPLTAGVSLARSAAEHRLLILDLFAGKLLAIAVWMSDLDSDEQSSGVKPLKLLELFDRIYFSRTAHEEHLATKKLQQALDVAIYEPPGRIVLPSDLAPALERITLRRLGQTPGLDLGTRSGPLRQLSRELHEEIVRRLGLEPARDLHETLIAVVESTLSGVTHRLRDALPQKPPEARAKLSWDRDVLTRTVLDALPTPPTRPTTRGTGCLLSDRHLAPEFQFLLRWISPTTYHQHLLRRTGKPPGNQPETLQDRYQLVCRLHLAAHLQLIRCTPDSWYQSRRYADDDRIEKKRATPQRHFLHRALFRYLVCRSHHWQLATQQDRTTGLSHFRRYYYSPHRRPVLNKMERARLVLERLRQWRGLRILEGRVGPPESAHEIVPWVLAHARPGDHERTRVKKFGLIVHFIKKNEGDEERPFSKRIKQPVPRLRWGPRRRHLRREGMRLYRMLRRPTPVVPFIVGIDAANLELATPPEVFAPVFRFLRELPVSTAGHARRFTPYYQLEPSIRKLVEKRRLGMTYHVGEDFRHLLSGLRAIDEVVRFLKPHPGDRLGHGTALALSPEAWLEHNGYQAIVPKLEWLDTLVWIHHFLGPGDEIVGELAIEDTIQRLSWDIYAHAAAERFDPLHLDRDQPPSGAEIVSALADLVQRDRRGQARVDRDWADTARKLDALAGEAQAPGERRGLMDWNWSPLSLWDAWSLRQLDPYMIDLPKLLRGRLAMRKRRHWDEEDRRWYEVQERVMRKLRANIGSRNAMLLLGLYWMSPEVRERGDDVLVIDMADEKPLWLELCRRVEDKMKDKIHQHELVVEVNPSANRIIGPMERYGDHHVFQLTLDEHQRLKREVRVSVNTDNPAVCNTSLAHEHYLLGEILIDRGVPEAEVVQWLDWLRENGNEYNFVRRLPAEDESPDMAHLLGWLRNIRPSVREARGRAAKLEAFHRWRLASGLRARGFSTEQIERDPQLVHHVSELERRLRALRTRAGGDTAAQAREIESLEHDFARLRKRVRKLEPGAG